MAGEIIDRTGAYKQSVEDLLAQINRVKTMLWAGDTQVARDLIGQVAVHHRDLINQALKFKKELLARRNRIRRQFEEEIRRERGNENRRRMLTAEEQFFIHHAVALETRLQSDDDIALFVTTPVANLAMRLYRMLFDETEIQDPPKESQQLDLPIDEGMEEPMPVKEHERSGFRFLYISYDNGLSETRAYHPDPPPLTIPVLIRVFQEALEASIEVIEKPAEHLSWPLWLRAFTPNALVDITFFDAGRVLLNITAKARVEGLQLVQKLLDALSTGQQVVRDELKSS
jgi:hypothetical protein